MSKEKHNKVIKQSFINMLQRTFLILFAFTMLTTCAVSGVYAKYVTSSDLSGSANMTSIGIETFKLIEYGDAVGGIDYSKVVPGADIPGPHIQLKINSELSYTLYFEMTMINFPPTYTNGDNQKISTISFDIVQDWKLVKTSTEQKGNDEYITKLYEYIVDKDSTEGDNYVFQAGNSYDIEIKIMEQDLIFVSQYYDKNSTNFTLTFKAYIQQVL